MSVNYAEGNVDTLVRKIFFRNLVEPGVFVEIGAARPDYISISYSFRQLGWRIIAVEPNPKFCELHRNKGIEVLEYACSNEDKDNVDFVVVESKGVNYMGGEVSFESFSSLGLRDEISSLMERIECSQTIIKVKVRRLDSILKEHASDVKQIDILAIDVEGWELDVLGGFNMETYLPKVVILENLTSNVKYHKYMAERNYYLWRKVHFNEVYIDRVLATTRQRVNSNAFRAFSKTVKCIRSAVRTILSRLRNKPQEHSKAA